jgi:lysophospholipase L1-like esterase
VSERVRSVALALSATVLALLAVEGAVRLWLASRPPPPREDRPAFFYAAPNAIPLHDYAHTTAKPAGVFRILVVGDSFTFPWKMQLDDAFSKRLERMLNLSSTPNGTTAEVLNFGTSGANAASEVAIVERGLKYDPDLVLLQITLNDPPQPQSSAEDLATYLPPPPITASTDPILFHWKTWVLLATGLNARKSRAGVIGYHHWLFADLTTFRDALRAIKASCAARGTPFVVVVFPLLPFPLDEHYPFADLHDRVASVLEDLAIPRLDLLAAFRGLDVERLQVRPGVDAHPNEIAHRIAAEQIYLWLERRALIPPALVVQRKFSERGMVNRRYEPSEDDGG